MDIFKKTKTIPMKNLIFFLILTFLSLNTHAQGFDLGVKAGVNFANITDGDGLDSRTGFVLGAFTGFKVSDKIGVQVEALYSQQGAEFDLGSFDLDYINIPLLMKFYLSENIHLHAGPQFGVLVNDDTQSVVGEIVNDIAINDTDFTGVVGLGFDVPFGLRIDARYNFGLSEVPEDVVFSKGKNSVIQLSLGYSFL